jgi:hypothetical protein
VLRRIVGVVVAGAALLAAFGCGASGNDASVRSGTVHAAAASDDTSTSSTTTSTSTTAGPTSTTVPVTTSPEVTTPPTATATDGWRTVTYQGVQFDVPADWPVYDLAAAPSTCVRFDVHAVYLGEPSADMKCPAGVLGRAEAVLVEPTAGERHRGSQGSADAADVAATTAGGLAAQVADDGAVASEIAADLPSVGLSVTLTYRDSDATAQQILQSFRAAA